MVAAGFMVPDAQIFDSSPTAWKGCCGLITQEPDARIVGSDARVKSLGNTFVNVLSEADICFRNRARKRSHSFSGVMTHAQQAIFQTILVNKPQSQDGNDGSTDMSERVELSDFPPSLSDDGELCLTPLAGMQYQDPQYATTMMVRNIPRRIRQKELAKEIDASGFRDAYDFIYLPCIISLKEGKGYAFVNFVTPDAAQAFKTAWNAKTRFKMGMKKVLDVSASSHQGKAANMAQWQRGKTNRITNPSFRPIIK